MRGGRGLGRVFWGVLVLGVTRIFAGVGMWKVAIRGKEWRVGLWRVGGEEREKGAGVGAERSAFGGAAKAAVVVFVWFLLMLVDIVPPPPPPPGF